MKLITYILIVAISISGISCDNCPAEEIPVYFQLDEGFSCSNFPGSEELSYLKRAVTRAPITVSRDACTINVCPSGPYLKYLRVPFESNAGIYQGQVFHFRDRSEGYFVGWGEIDEKINLSRCVPMTSYFKTDKNCEEVQPGARRLDYTTQKLTPINDVRYNSGSVCVLEYCKGQTLQKWRDLEKFNSRRTVISRELPLN